MRKSGSSSSGGLVRSKRWQFALFYLIPALLMYGFFVLWPLVNAFRLSMFRFTGLSQKMDFVGLRHFEKLAGSTNFFQSLKNNIWLLAFSLGIVIVLALLIAHATQDDSKFGKFLRAVYLFPHVISLVVVAMLWKFIFDPNLGFIQPTLQSLNIVVPGIDYAHGILGSSTSALPAVGLSFIWYALGFYVMVLAAGIRSIPGDVKEAAELDGATGLFRFVRITWPLIWSVRRIVVIHLVIAIMNTFALVRLMTDGGPDGATEVTLSYLYKRGFSPDSFYGEATAIGVLNFLAAMALTAGVIFLFGRDPAESRGSRLRVMIDKVTKASWFIYVKAMVLALTALYASLLCFLAFGLLVTVLLVSVVAITGFLIRSKKKEVPGKQSALSKLALLGRSLTTGFKYTTLCVYILIVVFPIAWMALSSFKTTREIYKDPWSMPAEFGYRKEQLRTAATDLQNTITSLPESFPTKAADAQKIADTLALLSTDPVVGKTTGGPVELIEPGGAINRIRLFAPELREAGKFVGRTERVSRNMSAYGQLLQDGETSQAGTLKRRIEGDYQMLLYDLSNLADSADAKVSQGSFSNYVEAWTTTQISTAFLNSVIVCVATMIVLIPIAAMAAYVLAKYKFRGSNALFMLFLGGMMFPQFLVIVPLFLQMSSMGLDDSLFGLTLVYIAFSLPFTVFVLSGFFHQLPDELAEAAMLDGCGHQATFWKIMMPLAKPGLVVVIIFDVIGLWNEYNLALVLLGERDSFTLPRALDSLQMTAQYLGNTGALMAAMVIVILPVLIVYWLLKEKIHEAMLAGAIKG